MSRPTKKRALGLWLWVGLGFAALFGAWAVLLSIARNNPVQSIQIEKPSR